MVKYEIIYDMDSVIAKINELIVEAKERIIINILNFDDNEYTFLIMKNLLEMANKNVEITIFIKNSINVLEKQKNLLNMEEYNLYAMHLINHPLVNIEITNNISNYFLIDNMKLILGNFHLENEVEDRKTNAIYLDGNELNKLIREEANFQTQTGEGHLEFNNNLKFMLEVIENTCNRIVIALDEIKNDKVIKSIKKICKMGLKVNLIIKKKNRKLNFLKFSFAFLSKKNKENIHLNIIEKKDIDFTNLIFSDNKLYYYFGNASNNSYNSLSVFLTKIEESVRQEILNKMID